MLWKWNVPQETLRLVDRYQQIYIVKKHLNSELTHKLTASCRNSFHSMGKNETKLELYLQFRFFFRCRLPSQNSLRQSQWDSADEGAHHAVCGHMNTQSHSWVLPLAGPLFFAWYFVWHSVAHNNATRSTHNVTGTHLDTSYSRLLGRKRNSFYRPILELREFYISTFPACLNRDAHDCRFPRMFGELEIAQTRLSIRSFGVSVTTMEEVFLKWVY